MAHMETGTLNHPAQAMMSMTTTMAMDKALDQTMAMVANHGTRTEAMPAIILNPLLLKLTNG